MPKFRVSVRVDFDADRQPTNSYGEPVLATVFGLQLDAKRAEDVLAMATAAVHGPQGQLAKRFGRDILPATTTLVSVPTQMIEIKETKS